MNRTPEADLIKCFEDILLKSKYINNDYNKHFGRNSKTLGDIEFVNNENEYLVIEAKSHHSGDAHNSYHKLFGELLKETGRNTTIRTRKYKETTLAILIPSDSCEYQSKSIPKDDGVSFYNKQFRNIPEHIYIGFGKLVNSKYVFTCSERERNIKQYTWEGFYKKEEPIRIWSL